MNSIWNKNLALFEKRFPALASQLKIKNEELRIDEGVPLRVGLAIPNASIGSEPKQAEADFSLEILPSKLKIPGANDFYPTARENGKFLHSSYNPIREAEQAARTIHNSLKDIYGAAFFSCGLGYEVLAYARLFPSDTIIVVESDARYFFTALSVLDWSDFFNAKNIVLLLETQPDQVISLIEKCGGFNHIKIYENTAQIQHAKNYFSTLDSLVERNKQKSKINSSTLEKFSSLWLKNSCRNLHFLAEKDGVKIYENHLNPKIPALILAAGPTLQEILPHLKELQKRAVIIAVDTALRACLNSNIQPDFVILCDPQYYAFRHIAGLHSPKSVLITESAAYPAVFRFDCRKIVMCSSMFPLGKFVESKLGSKGNLSAGGSVSTTAWDFARLIGAKKIVFSGLDLGYPDLETHIRGSTFEEKIHAVSNRLNPAEKSGIASLFAAGTQKSLDYNGNEILTDAKMKMFAWWFESKQEEFKAQIQSYSLSPKSLKIPGFKVLDVNELLSLPDFTNEKFEFFEKSEAKQEEANQKFLAVLSSIQSGLAELYSLADAAEKISDAAVLSHDAQKRSGFSMQLAWIDSKIANSQFKEIASLVFPTESQLSKIFSEKVFSPDELTANFQRSKIIYGLLKKSIREYQKLIQN